MLTCQVVLILLPEQSKIKIYMHRANTSIHESSGKGPEKFIMTSLAIGYSITDESFNNLQTTHGRIFVAIRFSPNLANLRLKNIVQVITLYHIGLLKSTLTIQSTV